MSLGVGPVRHTSLELEVKSYSPYMNTRESLFGKRWRGPDTGEAIPDRTLVGGLVWAKSARRTVNAAAIGCFYNSFHPVFCMGMVE